MGGRASRWKQRVNEGMKIQRIRLIRPGGPHARVFFDYALQDPNLDLVVQR